MPISHFSPWISKTKCNLLVLEPLFSIFKKRSYYPPFYYRVRVNCSEQSGMAKLYFYNDMPAIKYANNGLPKDETSQSCNHISISNDQKWFLLVFNCNFSFKMPKCLEENLA